MTATASLTEDAPGERLGARIGRLAHVIAHTSNSDRAALKRWSPGQPVPLCFYRLWLHGMSEDLPREPRLAQWAVLAWGIAFMGEGGHRQGRSLGRALAESGINETRVERLLAADDSSRLALFMSMVRFLAAKGEGFDWTDAARLLLTSDPDKREILHRQIATDFYRHQPHEDHN